MKLEKERFLENLPILIYICLSVLSCSVKAPEDYNLHLLAMEEAGEQERQRTGRKIGEIVMSEASLRPMVIALHPERKTLNSRNDSERLNPDLLKIIYPEADTYETEVETQDSTSLTVEEHEPEPTPAIVPIGINKELLEQSLESENVDVIGIVTKDGRLAGDRNLIQVHFASEAMSDDAIYEQFLYICAIIYGYDMNKNTVDTVMGFAIAEDFPYMVFESKMEDYVDFVNKNISYREWIARLTIRKLK
jgi:hypothetical protein